MQDLIKQEQFEMEVLDRLNTGRILSRLVFGGGTMLRLCHGLERFSVDLDFWLKEIPDEKLFQSITAVLDAAYTLKDVEDKRNTWLYEIKTPGYPRSLKIEIRKKSEEFLTEQNIAFSRFTSHQVLVTSLTLEEMARSKIQAFLQRREIRDVYDLEFLYKRGAFPALSEATKKQLLGAIEGLTRHDYQVKLGSLLEEPLRSYYREENFKILKSNLKAVK